jgi:hypothetical protein
MIHVLRGVLPIVLCAVLSSAVAAPEGTGLTRKNLKLRVSTHHGYVPVELRLEGNLEGLAFDGPATCLISVEYSYTTPGGYPLQAKEEFPCTGSGGGAGPGDSILPRTFVKNLTLEEPGTYSYRIVVEPRGGHRIAGTTQEVKVYRGRIGVDVRTIQRDP